MSSTVPTVSIVIPCYNYARYVGQAIESALGQTLPPMEIVVVNDGSTDNTSVVVRSYPVTLLDQPNQGQSRACNNGVSVCHGEFIILLSADDLLHPFFIERTLPRIVDDPEIAFVYTHGLTFGADQAFILAQGNTLQDLKWGNPLIATNLMRKSVFQAVGGYPADLRYGEDWDLYLTIAERGYRGVLVPEALLFIRAHANSLRNQTQTLAVKQAVERIWQRHPQVFTPGFILCWRARRFAHSTFHRVAMWLQTAQPDLYERVRRIFAFLRPRALDLERKRPMDLGKSWGSFIPSFTPATPNPWEEVLCQWR